MARDVVRRVDELGPTWVLAPERFDPRRALGGRRGGRAQRLAELVELVTDSVTAATLAAGTPVLVLDTSHAWDGLVVARHAPGPARAVGSAKRPLIPGDVIISRLRPYLRQVAFVDAPWFARATRGNAVVASTEFYVLRGKAGFDAAALVPFLLSPPVQAALAAGQEGGHHPRFARELLAELGVPTAWVRDSAAVARNVRARARAWQRVLRDSRADAEAAARAIGGDRRTAT
jgi:hypothetical protein